MDLLSGSSDEMGVLMYHKARNVKNMLRKMFCQEQTRTIRSQLWPKFTRILHANELALW